MQSGEQNAVSCIFVLLHLAAECLLVRLHIRTHFVLMNVWHHNCDQMFYCISYSCQSAIVGPFDPSLIFKYTYYNHICILCIYSKNCSSLNCCSAKCVEHLIMQLPYITSELTMSRIRPDPFYFVISRRQSLCLNA